MRDTRPPEPPEPTEHYIFNDGQTIVLERGFQWEPAPDRNPIELERMTAHCAVRALAELREGLVRPMTFGVTRNWVDEYGWSADGDPPRWNWFLRTPQSPSDAWPTRGRCTGGPSAAQGSRGGRPPGFDEEGSVRAAGLSSVVGGE